MSLKKIANKTVTAIADTVGNELSDKKRKKIAKEISTLVEQSIIEALRQAGKAHRDVTSRIVNDKMMAKELEEEIERKTNLLIANLNALR